MYLCVIASALTIDNLIRLKWMDKHKQIQKVKILEEVCSEWKSMGELLGLTQGELKAIQKDQRGVYQECCKEVFYVWFKKGKTKYTVSWDGLCELLRDMDLSALAKRLEEIFQVNIS